MNGQYDVCDNQTQRQLFISTYYTVLFGLV